MYMTQPVHKGLREQPNATAAICGADRVTRAELAGRVAQFAGALQRLDRLNRRFDTERRQTLHQLLRD